MPLHHVLYPSHPKINDVIGFDLFFCHPVVRVVIEIAGTAKSLPLLASRVNILLE